MGRLKWMFLALVVVFCQFASLLVLAGTYELITFYYRFTNVGQTAFITSATPITAQLISAGGQGRYGTASYEILSGRSAITPWRTNRYITGVAVTTNGNMSLYASYPTSNLFFHSELLVFFVTNSSTVATNEMVGTIMIQR